MPADADTTEKTTCIIAGGGPAGIMLGLLLARGGVDVTAMEKHADVLRDFRGDTVHASTLRLLDELGLADDFARMPHREIDTLNMTVQGTEVSIDVSRIPVPHKNIAPVPQWDLLDLLDVQLNRLRWAGSGSTWPSPTQWQPPAHWQARYAAAPSPPGSWLVCRRAVSAGQPAKSALVVRIADKVPALRTAAGCAIAIGPLPEHVPEFARR